MREFPTRLSLTALCLAAALGCTTARAVKHPDLSGTWRYNEEASQTMQREAQQEEGGGTGGWGGGHGGGPGGHGGGMGRRRGGGGYPGGGGRGGGGYPGGGGELPGREGGGGPEGGPRFEEEAGGAVTITWADPKLTLTYPSERQRVFFTDDRKVKEDRDGQTVKVRAHWTDTGSLEVVSKTEHGKRTEVFELSNDGRRLFVIIAVEGRGPRPFKIRRVYDRAEATDKAEDEGGEPQPA
jgi:hypothetical protein